MSVDTIRIEHDFVCVFLSLFFKLWQFVYLGSIHLVSLLWRSQHIMSACCHVDSHYVNSG